MTSVELTVTANKTLHNLADYMAAQPVIFAEIAREGDKDLPRESVAGVYVDRHIDSLIRNAQTNPDAIGGIATNFVPDIAEIDGYTFRRKGSNGLTIATKNTQDSLTQYSTLGLAYVPRKDRGLPFVIDAPVTTEYRNVALKRKLEPIRRLFKRNDLAYMLAVPSDSVTEQYKEAVALQGGVIVEFPISKDEFTEGALKQAVI